MKVIRALNKGIAAATGWIMVVAVAFMALSLAAAVFVRNFAGLSFDIIIDANRIMFVWSVFAGLVRLNAEDKMIRFDLIEQKLPSFWRRVLVVFRRLSCLALYAVMTYAGFQMYGYAKAQSFPTLPSVSLALLYLPVCVAGVLLIVQTIAAFAPDAKEAA